MIRGRGKVVGCEAQVAQRAELKGEAETVVVPAVEQRGGEAKDTGKVVAAMLRGDLAYSTGQVVNVDGGLMLRRL